MLPGQTSRKHENTVVSDLWAYVDTVTLVSLQAFAFGHELFLPSVTATAVGQVTQSCDDGTSHPTASSNLHPQHLSSTKVDQAPSQVKDQHATIVNVVHGTKPTAEVLHCRIQSIAMCHEEHILPPCHVVLL